VVPVVCGIIERGNRFLAALRGNTRQNAGRWEFPGGKIHAGEPAEKALVRELREELCLDISITAGLPPGLYTFDGMTIFKQYQLFKKCPRPSCFRSL
jgi:mutator protein MutT